MALSESAFAPYVRGVHTPLADSADGSSPRAGGSRPSAVPAVAKGHYINPILDWDFPDPAVIHAPDGFYYAYATQTLRDDRWINIQVARSADLIHWQPLQPLSSGETANINLENAPASQFYRILQE